MAAKTTDQEKEKKRKGTMGMINLKTIISKRVVCEGLCHKQTESCSISLVDSHGRRSPKEQRERAKYCPRARKPFGSNEVGLDWTSWNININGKAHSIHKLNGIHFTIIICVVQPALNLVGNPALITPLQSDELHRCYPQLNHLI